MNKEKQKQLLTDIMEADSKDGLYKQQTAVEWLVEEYHLPKDSPLVIQAKQMEKEQIKNAIILNQNGLLRRKTILEAEQYYNETYKK